MMWRKRPAHMTASCTPTASPLAEDVAMQLALTWEKEWRETVRVRLDAATDAQSLIPNVHYIDFDLFPTLSISKRKQDKLLAKMHVITLIWAMMSWCPGFRPDENPVFWRRVFDRVSATAMTDAERFFKDQTFPRIRLNGIRLDLIPRFCSGFCDTDVGLFVRRHLDTAVRTLTPFISPSRIQRVIQVAVHVDWRRSLLYDSVVKEMGDVERNMQSLLPDVVFCVDHLTVEQVEVETKKHLPMLHWLLKDTPAHIARLVYRHAPYVPRAPLNKLLHMISESPSGIRELTLRLRDCSVSDTDFGVLFTLLPQIRFLKVVRVRFDSPYSFDSQARNHLWHWLEYALYHPNTRESDWDELELVNVPVTPRDVALLNEVQKLRRRTRSQVHLGPQTIVRRYSTTDADELLVIQEHAWFDTCFWNASSGWTSIVIPGIGMGWVERVASLGERNLPTSPSQLRSLKWIHRFLVANEVETDVGPDIITGLVQAYGLNLRQLHATSVKGATVDHVMTILNAAPALRSLHLSHDGSIWSDNEVLVDHSLQLEELSFDCLSSDKVIPSQPIMNGLFANVTTLRLKGRVFYGADIMEQMQALLKRHPRLQYLYCSSDRIFDDNTDYAQKHPVVRHKFGLGGRVNQMAQTKLVLPCRLAFLSVVRHFEHHGTVSSGLDDGIVRNVFSYASSDIPRDVWVDRVSRDVIVA